MTQIRPYFGAAGALVEGGGVGAGCSEGLSQPVTMTAQNKPRAMIDAIFFMTTIVPTTPPVSQLENVLFFFKAFLDQRTGALHQFSVFQQIAEAQWRRAALL